MPNLGRVRLRRIHRRRLRPTDRGLARRDDQAVDLVMIPLRMALWQRDREGHPDPPVN